MVVHCFRLAYFGLQQLLFLGCCSVFFVPVSMLLSNFVGVLLLHCRQNQTLLHQKWASCLLSVVLPCFGLVWVLFGCGGGEYISAGVFNIAERYIDDT